MKHHIIRRLGLVGLVAVAGVVVLLASSAELNRAYSQETIHLTYQFQQPNIVPDVYYLGGREMLHPPSISSSLPGMSVPPTEDHNY